MWPFSKKQLTPSPTVYPRNSLFSTEGDLSLRKNTAQRLRRLNDMMALSIQRTAEDFQPVDENGNTIAMDDAGQSYSLKQLSGLGMGNSIPETQFNWYCGQGFIGWQAAAIISQNWLIDKACSMPAKDSVRNGYEIAINSGDEVDPEVLDYIREQDKEFEIIRNCFEFIRLGRVFGIRVALFLVDSSDPDYYAKPFNPDGVKPGSYKGISQIDPYWITPELSGDAAANPSAPDFYEPTWWRVNGKRIHRTHMIIYRQDDLPDILKPAYLYGGIPVPQKIAERVYAAERTANEAPMLAMTKRLTVMKCDITQAIANQQQFDQKMAFWTQVQNNFGVKIIGLDDEVQQHDTSLAELDAAIATQYQLVAAAAEVPATKLLGTQPKGFNSTGEYEEASYHEMLASLQAHDLSPLVNRHHLLLIRSHVAPKFKIKPFNTECTWNELDEQTAEEKADTELKKAQAAGAYVEMGAVDGYDVRQKLIADKDSGFNGIESIVEGGPGDRDAELEKAQAEQSSESEVNPNENESADASETDKWITINGTHVKIDDKGEVTEGPTALKNSTVLYHGTQQSFSHSSIKASSNGVYGPGVYFYTNPNSAKHYAGEHGEVKQYTTKGKLATIKEFESAVNTARAEGHLRSAKTARAVELLQEKGYAGLHDDGLVSIFDPKDLRAVE